jgi:hypothetical protein
VQQVGDKNKFILWCTVRETSNQGNEIQKLDTFYESNSLEFYEMK